MRSFLFCFVAVVVCTLTGCPSSSSTNIMENADQAAIDAYDAQVAKDNEALSGYKEAK